MDIEKGPGRGRNTQRFDQAPEPCTWMREWDSQVIPTKLHSADIYKRAYVWMVSTRNGPEVGWTRTRAKSKQQNHFHFKTKEPESWGKWIKLCWPGKLLVRGSLAWKSWRRAPRKREKVFVECLLENAIFIKISKHWANFRVFPGFPNWILQKI